MILLYSSVFLGHQSSIKILALIHSGTLILKEAFFFLSEMGKIWAQNVWNNSPWHSGFSYCHCFLIKLTHRSVATFISAAGELCFITLRLIRYIEQKLMQRNLTGLQRNESLTIWSLWGMWGMLNCIKDIFWFTS